MGNWWGNLNLREQLVLSIAGLIGVVILLDSLVIQPYRSGYQQMDERVVQAEDDLKWMQQAVLRLPQRTGVSRKISSGKVVSFIDQQINRLGLKSSMQQMTPIEDHSARIRLSDVEFDKLLRFFNAIDGSVFIQEIRLLPTDKKGFVDVSLVLGNGSED